MTTGEEKESALDPGYRAGMTPPQTPRGFILDPGSRPGMTNGEDGERDCRTRSRSFAMANAGRPPLGRNCGSVDTEAG